MKTLLLAALATAIAMAAPVSAQASGTFATGNDILNYCTADINVPAGMVKNVTCVGYIIGVTDMATWNCKNRIDATQGPTVDIVVDWLRAHPVERHRGSLVLITTALKDAHYCGAA